MFNPDLRRIALLLPAVLVGFTVHEFAHALSAVRLGDPTPREQGRLTVNPIAHIELIGFIMILSSGTVFASRLLYQRAWRRFLPYSLPLLFVFLSQFIIQHLDTNYERMSASPQIQQMKQNFLFKYEGGSHGQSETRAGGQNR